MRHMMLAAVVIGVLLCGGCDEQLDASSDQAFQASVEKVGQSLDDAKRVRFEEAVGTLMMRNVLFAPGDEETMRRNLKTTFDGKTADEVIAEGEKARAEADAEMRKLMAE